MSTKNKLLFSIVSLVLVVLAMGVATFSILSAAQQYIEANISVVYSAENINAKVKGRYSINGGTPVSLVNSSGGEMLIFEPSEQLATKTLSSSGSISLSPTIKNVFFVYTFINANPSGGTSMTVTFADGSSKSNLTTKYLSSTSSEPTLTQTQASSDTTGSLTLTIAANSSGYVAVYVEISSIYSDATYTSSTSAGITSTLASGN
jgi:hypothetical protein